jgi:hypothetical protein
MLRKHKSCSGRRSLFILMFLSAIGAGRATASDNVPLGYKAERYQQIWERNPFTIVTPVAPRAQPTVFDKLILLSWLNDGGADVVFVQNTETNEVQKITNEPNANSFRLVAIHRAADPKDAEVVIANPTERGSVKFRLETVAPPPQTAGAQPAVPPAAAQNTDQGAQIPPLQGMSRQAQAARAATNQQGGAVLTQPQLPGLPPRASEVRRKRLTAPPAVQQPVGVPTPAPNIPSQTQTQ